MYSTKSTVFVVLVSFFVLTPVLLTEIQTEVIQIENGKIEGKQARTVGTNRLYYVFSKIPYAKPPVGLLRFEPPLPSENWEGVLPTYEEPTPCVQPYNGSTAGNEDCLFINVYTTQLPVKTKPPLPVMIYIHGGNFEGGTSGYKYVGPDYLIEQDIVFVSFNYRLGIFGFLSLGDRIAPGNGGLKDQQLALKWVKKNIQHFGGDPNRITLTGHSAGSSSVSYHLQSPLSAGLFNAAILQSGTSFCALSYSNVATKFAIALAEKLSISVDNSTTILTGFKGLEAKVLSEASWQIYPDFHPTYKYNEKSGSIFAPVTEPEHEGAFITEKSFEIMKSGKFQKIPVLIGHTSFEIPVQLVGFLRAALVIFDITPSNFVPTDMNLINNTYEIGEEIKRQYFKKRLVMFSIPEFGRFVSDDLFNRPIQKFVRFLANRTTTYFYQFSYQGNLSDVVNRTFAGVSHGEELSYLYRVNKTANTKDALTRSRMIRLWTNFVKFWNPTPEKDPLLQNQIWNPVDLKSQSGIDYFNIDSNLTASSNPDGNFEFWNNLYETYGVPPFNTF